MGIQNKNKWLIASGVIALSPVMAFASPPAQLPAGAPQGGTILQSVTGPQVPGVNKPPEEMNVQQENRPEFKAPAGFAVEVKGFRISGNSIYTQAVLLPLINAYVGKRLGLDGLQQAAGQLSKFYRANGYFVARAYIPAQEIKNGIIEIAILEGRIGKVSVNINGKHTRLLPSVATATVASSAKPGDVVQQQHIERGLLLLNDLPGVDVKSTLAPSASVGATNLLVDATEGKEITGNVDLDNYGNKYTGIYRAGATLNINDPSGYGDLVTLSALTSGSGLDYGKLSYMSPIGYSGAKLGVSYYQMKYILGNAFSALDAYGNAKVASIYALYPLVRSRNSNVYGNVGFDYKKLSDYSNGAIVDDKIDDVYSVGVNGDNRDNLGTGGLSTFAATWAHGNLNGLLTDTYNNNALPLNALSGGNWDKFDYSATTLRRVTDRVSFYASFSGQLADKNLDPSEQFILGGPFGVRAYPQGEATGDSGELLSLETRYDLPTPKLPGVLQFLGFYDLGQITLHNNAYPVSGGTLSNIPNTYTLSGAGVGLNYTVPGDYFIHVTDAVQLGNNPGRDIYGNNSNGSNSRNTFWIQGVKWF